MKGVKRKKITYRIHWGLDVMMVPGVRISSASMLCLRLVPPMETSPSMSTPPGESGSESESDSATRDESGRREAACGLRMVMGIVKTRRGRR